ncbi:Uromodulin-like 1 [Labeo rohita]|uniref:Uromodulin-like 1 n=1 Tax=Labeo rohita TaxID=84645 RepID=A0ABQ8M015_LABRO|nr:Uromodulin-like 1 [Labeo rohita]
MPSEEQNSSSDNGRKVSTESPARPTMAVISSPGTDLFHTPHERQHSRTVNATTTTDKDAITSDGPSFVLASHSTGEDGTAAEPFQSDGDLSLFSNDEESLHPSAEAGFESMMNDTMTPAAHLSRGREKIPAFFHASLESKNQRVWESITPSAANGIPMVSASDPSVIDNLGESNESVKRWGENKTENWTRESFGADDPPNGTADVFLNKNRSTIMHFTVLQGTGLLTTELGQNPRNASEPEEQKNPFSPSSVILATPLQVKPTSQVVVNKMAESSKNPSTNGPKPFGMSLKHPDSMFLFSASKLTPAKNPDATTLNYFSNTATAAGEKHVTKQFVASPLISDSVRRIVSARDGLESKSIFHTKSGKERQIKPTFQTTFLHRLNKTDLSLTTENSSSLLKPSNLCSKEARTSNNPVMEKRNRMDHFPVWLSELIGFSTASLTNAEEATTASDKRMFTKQTQSSLAVPRTLSPQVDASKHFDQFDELSTAAPFSPLTKLKNVFHVFKVNDHQPQQPLNHFSSERLKPFVSVRHSESIPPSFTYATVKRFTNVEDFSTFDSTNQNQESQKTTSVISERPNVNSNRLTRHKMISINKSMSHFSIPITHTKTSIKTTMESFVNVSLFSHAVLQKNSFLLPTTLGKSQNTVTTDARVLSKLLSISKKRNSEYGFLNHSLTTIKIGLPLDDKQQHLKVPRGTVMPFFGSYTVSSIPSVQRLIEAHPGEEFLTGAPQSQSGLQIESYLNKRDGTAKPTTLKHHDQSSHSVVGMNQTSFTSISHRIVSSPGHTTVSPGVFSNAEFKQHLIFSALPSVSTERTMMQVNGLHMFVNLSVVKEHPLNMTSSPISTISRHTKAAERPEGALNTSPLESSTGTTSPTFPLHLNQMQNVLREVTLTQNQTEVFSTVNEHLRTTQSNFPYDEMSSSGTTDDVQKHLGRTALFVVTGEKFSPIVHTDLSFSSTETKSLPKGSLQSREGSEDISHGTTPFAESDSGVSAEFVSDLPVINRKRRVISPDSLSGLAQISDDICGTGNYTAEMSLNLERDIMPGDLIPALGNLRVVISLKTNNSQVNLEIKSCCLSPTVRLDEFNTTCCIFSRLPIDPHGIRLLPSVLSKRASFTISLFQMINYSTAYLHCDLSVCLRNHSECERQCVQSRNAHLGEEAGAIFSGTGNRISFGPVLKEADNSSLSETADDTEAVVVIISSVAGCLLACLALFLVWMANRRCLQRSAYCWSRALCEC